MSRSYGYHPSPIIATIPLLNPNPGPNPNSNPISPTSPPAVTPATPLLPPSQKVKKEEQDNDASFKMQKNSSRASQEMINNFYEALPLLQEATKQLREYFPEEANKCARMINGICLTFTMAALEMDAEGFVRGGEEREEGGKAMQLSCQPAQKPEVSPPSPSQKQAAMPTNSWANIVASSIPEKSPTEEAIQGEEQLSPQEPQEPAECQLRIVWISGNLAGATYSFLTSQIHTGPLMSIAFDPSTNYRKRCCIIFQEADDASEFMHESQKYIDETGNGIYGSGIKIERGERPYPLDDEIKGMRSMRRERRRLTFALSGLFHNVTEHTFKSEVCKVAGRENIEVIWSFNTGNATAVFTSVMIARLVLNHFHQKSMVDGHGPYSGLKVSFSADPCEKELRLIKSGWCGNGVGGGGDDVKQWQKVGLRPRTHGKGELSSIRCT
ncbi:MAG: hypothetical protein M1834_005628 [Cirrosporium novae-zelandiae]|nr:MAG: hypothetical protein M1834_005628 [Cirrosporium novae-zelandiae]